MSDSVIAPALTFEEWQTLPVEIRKQLLRAMNIRYTHGDKPTYKLNGPETLEVRLRAKGSATSRWEWKPMIEESLSPSSLDIGGHENPDKALLVLTPLGIAALRSQIANVRVTVETAFRALDGFGAHMQKVVSEMHHHMLEEIQAAREREEQVRAEAAQQLAAFRDSDDWGSF